MNIKCSTCGKYTEINEFLAEVYCDFCSNALILPSSDYTGNYLLPVREEPIIIKKKVKKYKVSMSDNTTRFMSAREISNETDIPIGDVERLYANEQFCYEWIEQR